MSSDDGSSRPGQWPDSEEGGLFGDREGEADAEQDPAPDAGPRRRGPFRRHPVLVSVVTLLVVVVVGAGGFALYLNSQLDDVGRVGLGSLPEAGRPPALQTEAVTILLGGVDEGDGRSLEEIAAGGWEPGVVRSDTIMVVHLTADREQAYLVSIPRDSYVEIYDENGDPQGMDKINAALSLHGPAAYVSTVEHLTDLRMDHLAVVDWAGFKDITDALGGVEIDLNEGFTDPSGTTWQAGTQVLDGEGALKYVRTRYGLPGGDLDRVARQQNFLRALRSQVLDAGTLTNPFTATRTVKAVVRNLTVDDEFDTGQMRGLALDLAQLGGGELSFLTAPFGSFGTTGAGASIVRLDAAQSDALWTAVAEDDIDGYLRRYAGEAGRLPAPSEVN